MVKYNNMNGIVQFKKEAINADGILANTRIPLPQSNYLINYIVMQLHISVTGNPQNFEM